jgi:hypothetical protein
MKRVTVLCAALVLMALPAAADFIVINEAFVSHTGTDTYEFVELCGTPGMSLSDLSIITIEGDSVATGLGLVDKRWNLSGVMPADGYYVIGCTAVPNKDLSIGTQDQFENGTETVLLVRNCTVATGTDVDTNNDGIADISVGTIVDGICFPDAGIYNANQPDRCYFGVLTFGPEPGTNYKYAGAARCADCIGAFRPMCFTNPLVQCDVNLYSNTTPGAVNDCPVTATDHTSWGGVKTLFR